MNAKEALQRLSDAELLKIVAEKQSSSALEALMVSHRSFLKIIVHGFLRNSLFEDDAIQEIWMKVYNLLQRDGYEDESHFPSLLRRIARNHCLDELRKKQDKVFVDVTIEGEEFIAGDGLSPEEILIQKEEAPVRLKRLTPHYRKVVEKRILEDKSVEETAIELNISEETVMVSLSRALQCLKGKTQKR